MKNGAFKLMKKAGKGFVKVEKCDYGTKAMWTDSYALVFDEDYDQLPEYVRTEIGEWQLNSTNTEFIKGKCPDMKAVIPSKDKQGDEYKEATPVNHQPGLLTYRIGDWRPRFCMVLETKGGTRKLINLLYFDHFTNNWSNGKWYIAEDDQLPVMYKVDDELKGLVMVIRWDED